MTKIIFESKGKPYYFGKNKAIIILKYLAILAKNLDKRSAKLS